MLPKFIRVSGAHLEHRSAYHSHCPSSCSTSDSESDPLPTAPLPQPSSQGSALRPYPSCHLGSRPTGTSFVTRCPLLEAIISKRVRLNLRQGTIVWNLTDPLQIEIQTSKWKDKRTLLLLTEQPAYVERVVHKLLLGISCTPLFANEIEARPSRAVRRRRSQMKGRRIWKRNQKCEIQRRRTMKGKKSLVWSLVLKVRLSSSQ